MLGASTPAWRAEGRGKEEEEEEEETHVHLNEEAMAPPLLSGTNSDV
jgi:hypothetical protein